MVGLYISWHENNSCHFSLAMETKKKKKEGCDDNRTKERMQLCARKGLHVHPCLAWLEDIRVFPRDPHILLPKILYFPTPKLVWREKKKSFSRVSYIFILIFFSALFSIIRIYVLYQEPWICFYTRLSSSTRSFSIVFFSPGIMTFFLLTRQAEKLQMRARPRTYRRAWDKFLLRLEKMRRENVKLLERVFFSYFAKKLRIRKPDYKLCPSIQGRDTYLHIKFAIMSGSLQYNLRSCNFTSRVVAYHIYSFL
jgi:hypothetical protein